jgi:hypothetical protein
VDGYTDRQSYAPGDPVTLYLNAKLAQRAVVRLYDYSGKTVYQMQADLYPQKPSGATPWVTGYGYQPSATLRLPLWLRSGVYLVEKLVPIIVRTPPLQSADVVIVYPTNTVAAYNAAGGRSMYTSPPAPIVSFHRPVGWTSNVAFFSAFLEWLAQIQLPYSVRYIADVDLENFASLQGAKALVVIGHSEYWTRTARENFDRFVLGGGGAVLLSGNNMWWQARYSSDYNQLICYKRAPDPIADPLLKTVNWTNTSLAYPILRSVGADFVHGGFGAAANKASGFHVLSPRSPVFRNVSSVTLGDVITMPTTEYDGAPLLNVPPTNGLPRIDLAALDAYRAEIIGYDLAAKNDLETGSAGPMTNVGTWLAYQRTASAGVVFNGASTNWCSRTGAFGQDGFRVRQVILNMLEIVVNRQQAFST